MLRILAVIVVCDLLIAAPVTAGNSDCNDNDVADAIETEPLRFVAPTQLDLGSPGLAVADLNDDGFPDLAATDGSGGVRIRLNDGFGSFGAPLARGADSEFAHALVAGDIDNDGYSDLAVGFFANDVVVMRNGGELDFTELSHIAVGGSQSWVQLVDIDGDRDLDLLTDGSPTNDSFSMARNRGNRGFGEAQAVQTGLLLRPGRRPSYATFDMEADDLVDVIAGEVGGKRVAIIKSLGDGDFAAPQFIDLPELPFSISNVIAADMDGDDDGDLIINTGVAVYVALNHGPGNFVLQPSEFEVAAERIVTADIDGDGDEDVIGSSGYDRNVRVLRNAAGRLSAAEEYPAVLNQENIAVADLDKDGHLDVVVNAGNQQAAVLQNLGDGTLLRLPRVEASDYGSTPAVAAGDFDRDGDVDVASASDSTPVQIHRNPGNGTFGPGEPLASGETTATGLVAADLDNDGDVDLVAREYLQLTILLNDGSGVFRASTTPVPAAGRLVSAGDLDGDGRPELLSLFGTLITVLRATADGRIESISTTTLPGDVVAAPIDVDADGQVDIVYAESSAEGPLVVLRSIGGGQYEEAERLMLRGLYSRPAAIVGADVDGDGDTDLVSSMDSSVFGDDQVFVLKNIGGVQLEAPQRSSLLFEKYPLQAADFDGDGDDDLVLTDLAVSRNHGSGVFGVPQSFPVVARAIAIADLNGDRRQDIAAMAQSRDGSPPGFDLVVVLNASDRAGSPDCDSDRVPDACNLGTDCNDNHIPDHCDPDEDRDSVTDLCDLCPQFPDGLDSDQDGTPDCLDECPSDRDKVTPGICGCNRDDRDTDGDGVADCRDNCDDARNPHQENSDSDRFGDACDGCPLDSQKDSRGVCGCGVEDEDKDDDGRLDCQEECPYDPTRIDSGMCGCGLTEQVGDQDRDGFRDCVDRCAARDDDVDADADFVPDCLDRCPDDPAVPLRSDSLAVVAHPDSAAVSLISIDSRQLITTIEAGEMPRDVAVDAGGRRLYVANDRARIVTVVDLRTLAPIAEIPMPGRAAGIAVAKTGDAVFVNLTEPAALAVIDPSDNQLAGVIATSPGDDRESLPLAVIPALGSRSAFVVDATRSRVQRIDVPGEAVTTDPIPLPFRSYGLVLSPDERFLYSASFGFMGWRASDGVVQFISYEGIWTSLALSSDAQRAFLAGPGGAAHADLVTRQIRWSTALPGGGGSVALSPDERSVVASAGLDVYGVSDGRVQTVSFLDAATGGLLQTINSPDRAGAVAVTPQRRGDANCDVRVTAADVTSAIRLRMNGQRAACRSDDIDGDCALGIADIDAGPAEIFR